MIFAQQIAPYYLSRYWLMRRVQYTARGKPEWAYAKWVVLNYAWKLTSNYIESGDGEKKFRSINEKYNDNEVLSPLHRAIESTFRASILMYRHKRGTGEKAKDVSTFFQRSKLDKEFNQFWNTKNNPYKEKTNNQIEKFKEELIKYTI